MDKLSDEVKACRIIEVLVSDYLCQDLEFQIAVHNNCHINHKDLRALNEKIMLIYELTHVANKPSCLSVHKDWSDKLERMYKYFRGKGDIRPTFPIKGNNPQVNKPEVLCDKTPKNKGGK